MADEPDPPPGTATVDLSLKVMDVPLNLEFTIPTAPVRLVDMVPVFQSLADVVAETATQANGLPVSCKAGCGACCRQLVPIAEVEARRIRALVDAMPEPRRTEVRARFADAVRRLDEAGLLPLLLDRSHWGWEDRRSIGLDYFAAGVACPFLVDESCSIHPDRPIACREYLVTSPAENCSNPTADTVRRVPVPPPLWKSLARFDPVPRGATWVRWVPLVLALDWADEHPDEGPTRPGPVMLGEMFDRLKDAPPRPLPTEAEGD
jgi:Fe-S-cluster containining protein